jgi:molybdopterin-guanine dinucleotide biosynthesis adapter protein
VWAACAAGTFGMKRVHIIGRRNAGKTTLLVDLVGELIGRGYAVGTVKHTSHNHELDTPGKDSHRHRLAGGSPAAVITEGLTGIYLPTPPADESYERLSPLYDSCDLVLVEGDQQANALKVEVWRQAAGSEPIARQRHDVAAIVTDDPIDIGIPVWPREDVPRLTSLLLALIRDHWRHFPF